MRSVSNPRFRTDLIGPPTVLVLLVLLLCASPRSIAAQFQKLDREGTVPVLVIASIESAEEMEAFPQCASEKSLCRDPAPALLALEVRRTVYGPAAPTRVLAATTSHYGFKAFRYVPGRLWLMLLATDRADFVMVRYAYEEFGADGELLLVPDGDYGQSWLPCTSAELYRLLLPSEVWDWPLESSVGRLGGT